MTIKKFITPALLLSSLIALSAFASSVTQRPGIKELETNREYMQLIERSGELSTKADSINMLLSECRKRMDGGGEAIDIEALRAEIIVLEQQAHDISVEQGTITRRIGSIEQEHIMQQILSQQQHVVVGEIIDDSEQPAEQNNAVANLVDNECFKTELSADDYADLLRAQNEEMLMVGYAEAYLKSYEKLAKVAKEYAKADRASVADPLYEQYEQLSGELATLDESMNSVWNHILDTKYFSMAYILEKSHRYDILDRASANYQTMQQRCAKEDGRYSSDALMRYALGRRTLLSYEWEFARDMRLKPAQDSLRGVLDKYVTPIFNLEPIVVEHREFKDFAKVKIGRTNFYDESNPLPELKVYDNGTIYRLLLGKFRSKQAMTLFKGVQPMSIARDADGQYCYYAGGYATEQEALDDLQFLKDKGFKGPEIYCWTDGQMTNITASKGSSSKSSTPAVQSIAPASNVQYMVIISAESLDSKMRSIISSSAPGKSVSRSGANYVVGLFKDRGEADTLIVSLSDAFPSLKVTLSETKVE